MNLCYVLLKKYLLNFHFSVFEKFHCNHPGLLRILFWEFPASNPLYKIYYSFWRRYTFASNYVVITFKAFKQKSYKNVSK